MKLIALYYSALCLGLCSLAVMSLYQGSLSLIASRHLSQVEKQIALNEQKQQELRLQVAEQSAASVLFSQAESSGYQVISQVAILEPITTVASR